MAFGEEATSAIALLSLAAEDGRGREASFVDLIIRAPGFSSVAVVAWRPRGEGAAGSVEVDLSGSALSTRYSVVWLGGGITTALPSASVKRVIS